MSNFARRFGILRTPDGPDGTGGGGTPVAAAPATPKPTGTPTPAPKPEGTGGSDSAAELARLRRLANAQAVLMDQSADPIRQDEARSEILRQHGYSEAEITSMREQARREAEATTRPPKPAKGKPKPAPAADPEDDQVDDEETNPLADELETVKAELERIRGAQHENDVDRLKRDIQTASTSNLSGNEFIQKLMTKKTPAQRAAAEAKIAAQIRARTIQHLRTMQGQSGASRVNNAWVEPAVAKATQEISAELQAVLDGLDLGHAPETEPEVTTILAKPKVTAPKYKPGMDAEAAAGTYTADSLERLAAEQYHAGSKA